MQFSALFCGPNHFVRTLYVQNLSILINLSMKIT